MQGNGPAVGVGDELTDRRVFHSLLSWTAAPVIRLDPTAIGGITGALGVYHLARSYGRKISPHIYPELNVHLASGLPGCVGVEMFDPTR